MIVVSWAESDLPDDIENSHNCHQWALRVKRLLEEQSIKHEFLKSSPNRVRVDCEEELLAGVLPEGFKLVVWQYGERFYHMKIEGPPPGEGIRGKQNAQRSKPHDRTRSKSKAVRSSGPLRRQRQTKFASKTTTLKKSMPPQLKVEKTIAQRGSFCLYRLVKRTAFTCNRCGFEKKSKLLAFAKDKRDEPMCGGCYGRLLSASEKQDEAP
jgi:hypothetical protein